jgi:hypothetical protein
MISFKISLPQWLTKKESAAAWRAESEAGHSQRDLSQSDARRELRLLHTGLRPPRLRADGLIAGAHA